MSHVMLHTPDTALWHALVGEAQAVAGYTLAQETESYLVTTLMRFIGNMSQSTNEHNHSMDMLDDFLDTGRIRYGNMQEVADQCLIFAGLFPDYAGQKQISINYFVELGQGTYAELAAGKADNVYAQMSRDFVKLMDVLQSLREIDDGYSCLDPMQAHELWTGTGSQNARKTLEKISGSTLIVHGTNSIH